MYALHVIQDFNSFQLSVKSHDLFSIPLSFVVYDHNSQCYSCMSVVNNIDLTYP